MKSSATRYDFTWAIYAMLGVIVYLIGLKL